MEPGFRYVIENEVSRGDIKILIHLLAGDKDINELYKLSGIGSTSCIYRTIKLLLLKGYIKLHKEAHDNRSRYSLV